jgi:hypothetical protein
MNKKLFRDSLIWGFFLWLIGYILSFILFFIVPPTMIGWFIAPIGTTITLLVLFKKIKGNNFNYYLSLGIAWLLIAIALDYIFIVKLLNPTGYYKPAVFLYYGLTLGLPILVWKIHKHKKIVL